MLTKLNSIKMWIFPPACVNCSGQQLKRLTDQLKPLKLVTSMHLTYHWLSCTGDHRCTGQDSFLTGWHTAWTMQQENLHFSATSGKGYCVLRALVMTPACSSFGAVCTSLSLPVFTAQYTYTLHSVSCTITAVLYTQGPRWPPTTLPPNNLPPNMATNSLR